MRPEWHRCETCYFEEQGQDGFWCFYDPYPLETVEDSFCSRWVCEHCGGCWDDGEDHYDCITIEVELE